MDYRFFGNCRWMHRSSDLTDEPSRFKQFAWEQWENLPFAVLFRYVRVVSKNNTESSLLYFFSPGTYGLDRYVVKRYVEQVLAQSDRWKQLSSYLSSVSPSLRAYTLTAYEVELMQRILDFHLNDTLHLRITTANDQLIEYDDLLDFIRRVQDHARTHSQNGRPIPAKKTAIPTIPTIHSSYVLPPSAKSLIPSAPQPTPSKSYPAKPTLTKPLAPSIVTIPPTIPNKNLNSSGTTNGHGMTHDTSTRSLSANSQVKPNLTSPSGQSSTQLTTFLFSEFFFSQVPIHHLPCPLRLVFRFHRNSVPHRCIMQKSTAVVGCKSTMFFFHLSSKIVNDLFHIKFLFPVRFSMRMSYVPPYLVRLSLILLSWIEWYAIVKLITKKSWKMLH